MEQHFLQALVRVLLMNMPILLPVKQNDFMSQRYTTATITHDLRL